MNQMTRTLAPLVGMRESMQDEAGHGRYAQRFHLMPRTGWLNDPNGLCQLDGVHHAYYQYSPFDVDGGLKFWGHATSTDLVHWEDTGCALYPDTSWDVHGVYSGSTLMTGNVMNLFFTGNVKLSDFIHDFDFVSRGREANTLVCTSEDGVEFSDKHLLLDNADYPADVTCHVRDPKVFENPESDGPIWIMVQGARRGDGEEETDIGEVLVYGSYDLIGWELMNRITTPERFGYMWECPDYFETGGVKVLSVSPQGLGWVGKNIYQSGWFELEGSLCGGCELGPFRLWDEGFDFYAPQSYEDGSGRRVLIGWMGMPDVPEHFNRETLDGWQHCFTAPREVAVEDGVLKSRPVAEIEAMRTDARRGEGALSETGFECFDLLVEGIGDEARIVLAGGLRIEYRGGSLAMAFDDVSKDGIGGGRGERRIDGVDVRDLRVLADVSSVEVFVNGGERVMTTRYYPEAYSIEVDAPGASVEAWKLEG
jgi:beta-fructofuranosidase